MEARAGLMLTQAVCPPARFFYPLVLYRFRAAAVVFAQHKGFGFIQYAQESVARTVLEV